MNTGWIASAGVFVLGVLLVAVNAKLYVSLWSAKQQGGLLIFDPAANTLKVVFPVRNQRTRCEQCRDLHKWHTAAKAIRKARKR